ncbi:hypothetical protein MHBO_005032, partial [Bonamia ostreae]
MVEKLAMSAIFKNNIVRCYKIASASMSRLNKKSGELLTKYGAKAATDVTGFGLLGHLQSLVEIQESEVGFAVETIPVIKDTAEIDGACNKMFRLLEGLSAETSGGIAA